MAQVLKEKILENICIAPDIFRMKIQSEYTAANALPGQFVNMKCSEGLNALLRRPISICSVNRDEKTFEIIYQVRGKGTEYLSKLKAGDKADIIAPLGRGFDLSESFGRIAVVGGGIGIFPLLFLLKEKKAELKSAYIGFRDKEHAILADEFDAAANSFDISTDDGSLGYGGLVTDLLEKDLLKNDIPENYIPENYIPENYIPENYITESDITESDLTMNDLTMNDLTDDNLPEKNFSKNDLLKKDQFKRKFDVIYTCGPTPMIKKVAEIAEKHGIKCQVSLEQRMGCGIGACLVCACKTKFGDEWEYSHVCKDGPVFWSREVVWDD